jgi:hypothetical protein
MKNKITTIITSISLALIVSACSDRSNAAWRIKTPINDKVALLTYTDDHGGFHGDGEAWYVFQFTEQQLDEFVKQIKGRKGWNALPATGDALTVINRMPPAALQNLQHGYYFFRDKQQEWDFEKNDEAQKPIDSRHSWNYVIAILNTETGRLYIYNIDT